MKKRFLALLTLMMLTVGSAQAQLQFSGSVDLEYSAGDSASNFLTNGISNDYRRSHLGINQLNLFGFAQIDDDWSFNTRITWHTWGTGRLNNPQVLLAELTWQKPDAHVGATIGRFVSPFGMYARRQLAADNSLVNAPLLYEYFINVSEIWGFWPIAGNSGAYDQGTDVGVTTIYFGGYTTGGKVNWAVSDQINLDLGVTNAALASTKGWTKLANAAVVGRAGFKPLFFWEQGVSVNHGSFMELETVNRQFDNLTDFRQTLIGTDWNLAYSYFELSGEFVLSKWKVPGFAGGKWIRTKADSTQLAEFELENSGFYVDLRVEPPFLTGSYIAVRAEQLTFKEYDHPAETTSTIGKNPWDDNVTRFSVAAGYKLSRSILLKATYLMQDTDVANNGKDPKDNAFRAILTASF